MLSTEEIKHWCLRNNISEKAESMITTIRTSPPSRRVGGGSKNVSGRYPSQKMGVTIQFESHRVELPFIYELENDDDVLEYYDQPNPIKLEYLSQKGKKLGVLHTPDYFVIRRNSAGWVECKTESKLIELQAHAPNRHVRTDDGLWICPPGEKYASQFGLHYRFWSDSEIQWVLLRNIMFLEDYFYMSDFNIPLDKVEKIDSLVRDNPGDSLEDLIGRGISSDDIYTMIVYKKIYVDLYAKPLAEPWRVLLYIDEVTSKSYDIVNHTKTNLDFNPTIIDFVVGTVLVWNGAPWTIVNSGGSRISLLSDDDKPVEMSQESIITMVTLGTIKVFNDITDEIWSEVGEMIRRANPMDLKEANRRYEIIGPRLLGEKSDSFGVAERTIRYWIRKYRDAEILHGTGFVGLLPMKRVGNTRTKLPQESVNIMQEVIDKFYEDVIQPSKTITFGMLENLCKEKGCITPSYKTFAAAIESRPQHEAIEKEKGKRAAYLLEPRYWELSLTTPRHGDRPFEVAHIDHTKLDIELIDSTTGKNLGRCEW